jgi:uncharacterized protein YgiM (DUF1202 family)
LRPDFVNEPQLAALPGDVRAILSQALAVAPEERIQTAAEMAAQLTAAIQRVAAPDPESEPLPPAQPEAPPADTPQTAAPEDALQKGLPSYEQDPRWLTGALVGLAIILTLCCLLAIYGAFSVNERMSRPRSAPRMPTVATARQDTNVRAGPSLDTVIVGLLRKGEQAEILGISADGQWWQIAFNQGLDGMGWVPASYVTVGQVGGADDTRPPPLTPLPVALNQ